ncbi:MAG TPA: flagellar biosynthetic protein FliO [Candidatus Kapabacteria bacterium]|nr:flagellar biosynthetic protein FliO [Candidatus Kapabacteria bacterium]
MPIDSNILNAFLTLMGSVAILGIILFVMKKFTLKFRNNKHENGIEILSRLNLSPKNSLWTIKVQGKTLLLGVSEKNINLITELVNNSNVTPTKLETKRTIKESSNNTASEANQLINEDLSFKEFLKSAVFKSN